MLPMVARPFDDKPSDTLVVGFGRRFWTGSSTLPHLHQLQVVHDLVTNDGVVLR